MKSDWQVISKSAPGRGISRYSAYYSQCVVIVTKTDITLTPAVYEQLGRPEWAQVLLNGRGTQFAIRSTVNDDIATSFKCQGHKNGHMARGLIRISAKSFITTNKLFVEKHPVIYRATHEDGMIIVDMNQKPMVL